MSHGCCWVKLDRRGKHSYLGLDDTVMRELKEHNKAIEKLDAKWTFMAKIKMMTGKKPLQKCKSF